MNYGLLVRGGAHADVAGSKFSRNYVSLMAYSDSAASSSISASDSVFANDDYSLFTQSEAAGATTSINVTRCTVTHANSFGIYVRAVTSSVAYVSFGYSMLSKNAGGYRKIDAGGNEAIYTFQNNQFIDNGTSYGSLTGSRCCEAASGNIAVPRKNGRSTMSHRTASIRALALFAALLICATAQAQLFRAYLSGEGNDANPCTLQLPCRLLPAALAAMVDGGEIWMVDSANFNTSQVNITKSVTILAVPGALGSVVATGGGNALNINTAGVKVTLRNLVIVHLNSSVNGINFTQGAELNVVDCDIANMQNAAIDAGAPGSKVNVTRTHLRGSPVHGFHAYGTVMASLDSVNIRGNQYGVIVDTGAQVAISNSVSTGNSHSGLFIQVGGGGSARVTVDNSVFTGNAAYGIAMVTYNATDVLDVSISRSTMSHNSVGLTAFKTTAGATLVAMLSDSTVVHNSNHGIELGGNTPVIYTRNNNTVEFNVVADVFGGALTARPAK
jgi:hypothetical protein